MIRPFLFGERENVYFAERKPIMRAPRLKKLIEHLHNITHLIEFLYFTRESHYYVSVKKNRK